MVLTSGSEQEVWTHCEMKKKKPLWEKTCTLHQRMHWVFPIIKIFCSIFCVQLSKQETTIWNSSLICHIFSILEDPCKFGQRLTAAPLWLCYLQAGNPHQPKESRDGWVMWLMCSSLVLNFTQYSNIRNIISFFWQFQLFHQWHYCIFKVMLLL